MTVSTSSTAWKRYLPTLTIVGFLLLAAIAVMILPNDIVDRDFIGVGGVSVSLIIAVLGFTVPRGLVGAVRFRDRVRGAPEAYVAVALALFASAVGVAPRPIFISDVAHESLVSIPSMLALASLCLASFRVQDHNERMGFARPTLHSPEALEERFSAVAQQLGDTAEEFALLQAEVQARAALAKEFARQAEASRERAERDRVYAAEQTAALEALERLVEARAEPIVNAIELKSRRSQVVFLLVGAVLGTGFQTLVDIFL
ncbi:hypothetical protein [Nonomuraea dietziae]|uniref:hypothetical protein n=1 Tax=Nonomuraea dietziae TaxID=65515 RepID=UPI003428F7D0